MVGAHHEAEASDKPTSPTLLGRLAEAQALRRPLHSTRWATDLAASYWTTQAMFQGDIQGNPGLEAKAGGDSRKLFTPDDTCGPNPEAARADEAQLAEAAVEENIKKKKPKKSRYELERYASKIVKMGGDGKEEFFQHLGRRMREAGTHASHAVPRLLARLPLGLSINQTGDI